MGKIKIISRPDPNRLPDFQLPFHVRSVGCNESDCGWCEYVPGGKKLFVQVFWTLKGSGEITLPDRKIITREGEVFYHLPGEDHRHRTLGKQWHYYWFTFDGAGAADFITSYGYGRDSRYAGECPVKLFLELELLLRERTPYAQRHAISAATEILALAGGRFTVRAGQDVVRRFIEIAQESASDTRLSAIYLAKKLGVHRTTLNRIFLQEMGMTPGSYLQELRIQHALSLLRETELPIKAIASECGMPHASYFCRLIRKVTGFTPADYRKQGGVD